MTELYFISDVHLAARLSEAEKKKQRRLLSFLEHIEGRAHTLYILGDLFDFWFEWYHVIPRYWFPVIHRLRRLIESGTPVFLIPGNHDFAAGSYLKNEVGISCVEESYRFTAGEKRFFLAHGDGLARSDRGYRILKRIVRSSLAGFLFRTFIPADLGMQLAKWISRSSREFRQIDRSAWNEEYFAFAREKFAEGYDHVLLGHLHLPVEREVNGKKYINCGDWLSHFSYARFDGRVLGLHSWSRDNETPPD